LDSARQLAIGQIKDGREQDDERRRGRRAIEAQAKRRLAAAHVDALSSSLKESALRRAIVIGHSP